MPRDWYLWPKNQKSCKKKSKSCAPPLPAPLTTIKEIRAFAKRARVKSTLKRLPNDKKVLKKIFKEAAAKGRIAWLGTKGLSYRVSVLVEKEIASAASNQDVFVVIGTAHGLPRQTKLVNRILKYRKKVILGLERDKKTCWNTDRQAFWDNYILTKQNKPVVVSKMHNGVSILPAKEVRIMNQRPQIVYNRCHNVVLTDIPCKQKEKMRRSLDESDYLSARDNFAVRALMQKKSPNKRDVVFVECGATHAENRRLPAYIKHFNPQAKIVSVIITGGTTVTALTSNVAIKELGWNNKNFVLFLKDYEKKGDRFVSGDIIVYIAAGEREKTEGVRSGVIQPLVAPLTY